MTQAKKQLAVLFASLLSLSPAIAAADSDSFVVDCSQGQSIAEGLAKKHPDRPLTVVIRGSCMEGVVITRDDLSLIGDGGSIRGSVTVDGARRAVIAHLAITNPAGDGITVTNGGSATIRNNHVDDNSGYGLFLRNASFAVVDNNTFLRNGAGDIPNLDASGIGVALGSMVRASGNQMSGNRNAGVEVFDNSTYRSVGDTIVGGGRSAVDTFRNGYVDLRDVTVTGQVFVNQQSQLQARNVEKVSSFAGNISVSQLSFLRLRAGVNGAASTLRCVSASYALCQCDAGERCPVVLQP